ncbi:MAG TPA: aspartate dehydrogenase [Xanthobacteraceae bacterium]|nr:aspartate dehydrogenase [Xanthobacteraceae bacterium]
MSLRRLAIIGAGGIADVVATTLANGLRMPLQHASILIPAQFADQAQALLDRAGDKLAASRAVRTDLAALLADRPDAVAECASHVAVRDYGPAILESGCDLVVISIGSLSDDGLRTRLEQAAAKGGSRLVLPAGAIGGIDALVAARLSGLESVVYTGRKPPKAWRGTPAETLLDLDALKEATVFFEGHARKAAQDYPFNANVAATLALAGIGFEQTQVRLIADPGVTRNVHEFIVRSACGDFTMKLEGRPSPANPKTSLMAGYSMARELLNRAGTVVI